MPLEIGFIQHSQNENPCKQVRSFAPLLVRGPSMRKNGVIPIPPARRAMVRESSDGSVNCPNGPSRSIVVPRGISANIRLKGVFRRRVATMSFCSEGALARVRDRVWPSGSDVERFGNDRSINCPAVKVNPAGRSR